MSAPVDVLPIIDDLIEHAALRIGERQALQEVRAAVAELIDACDAVLHHGGGAPVTPGVAAARVARLRSALAQARGSA